MHGAIAVLPADLDGLPARQPDAAGVEGRRDPDRRSRERRLDQLFMQINNIDTGQERGLLDITLDPDFDTNGHFYLYYTPDNPEHARISRFTFEENSGGLTSTADRSRARSSIWEDTDGYLACCHYGGGLDFGPDGKIWLTTSDKFQASTPGEGAHRRQRPAARRHLDLGQGDPGQYRRHACPTAATASPRTPGTIRTTASTTTSGAMACRNPFRARWDAEYGNFYIAEVGGNQQLIAKRTCTSPRSTQPGAFFGWPFYEGTESTYVNGGISVFDPDDYPDPNGGNGPAYPNDFYSPPIWSLPHDGEIFDPAENTSASLTGGEVYRGRHVPRRNGTASTSTATTRATTSAT